MQHDEKKEPFFNCQCKNGIYGHIYHIYIYIYGHTDDIHTPKNYTKLHHFHTLKKSQADFDAHFNLNKV